MNPEFRTRILLPIVLPVTLAIGILAVAFSLSRVLLAISPAAASLLALLVSLYVLGLAVLIPRRANLTSTTLGAVLVLGFVAVLGAGALAANAGHYEEETDEEETDGGDAGFQPGPDDLVYVADDIDFVEFPSQAAAGSLTFVLDNRDNLPHNIVIDETGTEVVGQIPGGTIDGSTVELEAGTYTIYCSVPGHRATMEESLTVE